MRDAVRLAIGTLTALPVTPPATVDPPVPGRAMALAPLAGLVPGGAAGLVTAAGVAAGLPPGVVAVLVVGTFALTTRGLHLDGLADTADGLAASYDRDKALTVMRRGDTGPNGLAAVVLVLLLQTATLSQVLLLATARADGWRSAAGSAAVVVAVAVAARVAIPVACRRGVPPARPSGLGATVAGSVGPAPAAAGLAVTAGLCATAVEFGGLPWWTGILAVGAVVLTSVALVRRAVHRFGGITGDVIGAAVELSTATALLTLAALGSSVLT